jgi:hypothetical protein
VNAFPLPEYNKEAVQAGIDSFTGTRCTCVGYWHRRPPGYLAVFSTFARLRPDWRSEADRTQARTTLAESVATARQTVERLKGTQDPALAQLIGQLIIHSDLADDSLQHPEMLRR